MDPHLIPSVLAATASVVALVGESRRLPAQNVVALALITPLLAFGMEWAARGFVLIPASSAIRHVVITVAALLTARSMARLPGPGPDHLYLRTVVFGLAFAGATHWPLHSTRDAFTVLFVRGLLLPPALLILAPWWINKRLQPRQTPVGYALAGPILLLALALHSAADGLLTTALVQTTAASAALAWFGVAQGTRTSPEETRRSPRSHRDTEEPTIPK